MTKSSPENLTPTTDKWKVFIPNTPAGLYFLQTLVNALRELEESDGPNPS